MSQKNHSMLSLIRLNLAYTHSHSQVDIFSLFLSFSLFFRRF